MGKRKKLAIGFIVIMLSVFLLSAISDYIKYYGLDEYEKNAFKDMERACDYSDSAEEKRMCLYAANQMLELTRDMNNPEVGYMP